MTAEQNEINLNEKIRVSTAIKQQYQYLFSRHLSYLGLPLNFSYLREIVVTLLSDERIMSRVKEELIRLNKINKIDIEKILNSPHDFTNKYYVNNVLTSLLQEKKQQVGADSDALKELNSFIVKVIKLLNTDLPLINDRILLLFIIAVKNTDLEYVNAPREEIINPGILYDPQVRKKKVMAQNE